MGGYGGKTTTPDPVVWVVPQQTAANPHAGPGEVVWLDHHLPRDPAAAFNQAAGSARHLEATLAGGAAVGNNLGAALDAARGDSLYAQILFLLLGIPGGNLAGLLTASLAASGADRRRRDLALLRIRGASVPVMVRTAGAEAAAVSVGAAALGLAAVVGRAELGSPPSGPRPSRPCFGPRRRWWPAWRLPAPPWSSPPGATPARSPSPPPARSSRRRGDHGGCAAHSTAAACYLLGGDGDALVDVAEALRAGEL